MIRLDPNLLRVGAMTLAAGLGAYAVRGWDGVARGLAVAADLLVMVGPAVVAGLALAAALRVLVPPGVLARWMGAESGARGLLLASLAGLIMPGGPLAAFPVVLVLAQAGADRGALITFVLSWALNGFQRIVIWELPVLGADFALLRFLVGLPLPFIAGWVARRLPIRWTLEDAPARGTRASDSPRGTRALDEPRGKQP